MDSALAKILDNAEKEAKNYGDSYVSVEHLFLAILKEKNNVYIFFLRQIVGLNKKINKNF